MAESGQGSFYVTKTALSSNMITMVVVWESPCGKYEEGHTVKTNEPGQHIFQVAQHRRQTAAFLCQRVRTQLDQLANRQRRLQALLDQLRTIKRACRAPHARQYSREVAALLDILQRMPGCRVSER